MKQSNDSNQFVIAHLVSLEHADRMLLWAVKLAKLLNKGLILLHISDKRYTQITTSEAEMRLIELNNTITDVPIHSYAALNGRTADVIHSLGEMFSSVLVVTQINLGCNSPENLIKNYSSSRIAYFVFDGETPFSDFENVLLPLNMLREAKEKVLWASYFGRFSDSRITIFHKQYGDEFHQKQLNSNIKFAESMLQKFEIATEVIDYGKRTPVDLDILSLAFADANDYNLVLCQTTRNKSFLNWFFPLTELQVAKKIKHKPILFLNPRDDLFVLCE
jgi:hypothetical protein